MTQKKRQRGKPQTLRQPTTTVPVRLGSDQRKKLDRMTRANKTTRSAIIRLLIDLAP